MHTISLLQHVSGMSCTHVVYCTYLPYHTIPPAFNLDLLDGKPHTRPIPTLTKILKYLPGRCTTWDYCSTGIPQTVCQEHTDA